MEVDPKWGIVGSRPGLGGRESVIAETIRRHVHMETDSSATLHFRSERACGPRVLVFASWHQQWRHRWEPERNGEVRCSLT
jgi:hypothetical protein